MRVWLAATLYKEILGARTEIIVMVLDMPGYDNLIVRSFWQLMREDQEEIFTKIEQSDLVVSMDDWLEGIVPPSV